MHTVVVANGAMKTDARLSKLWDRADLRIAADGGAQNARLFLDRAPHIVIGDLDSLDKETRAWLERNGCEFIRHPRAKDETDLELALNLAETRGADEITLLGALGGRPDQFIANVLLLTQTHTRVRLVDAASEMWIGHGLAVIHGAAGDIVSLIPLDKRVDDVSTAGLKYRLRGESLERGSTRGISNVMLTPRAQVRWSYGTLLIVHLAP